MTPSTSCAFHTAKISRAIWRLSCVPVQPCVSSFGSPGTLHHGSPQPAGEGRNGGGEISCAVSTGQGYWCESPRDAARLCLETQAEYHSGPESCWTVISGSKSRGGSAMPMYEYYCDKCERDVTVPLTISEHEKGRIKCPKCG